MELQVMSAKEWRRFDALWAIAEKRAALRKSSVDLSVDLSSKELAEMHAFQRRIDGYLKNQPRTSAQTLSCFV